MITLLHELAAGGATFRLATYFPIFLYLAFIILFAITALVLALIAWRRPVIRSVTTLPTLKAEAITPYSSD